ncbi:MAG: DUF885 domain-containing protein [Pseudomonadota bacterium]
MGFLAGIRTPIVAGVTILSVSLASAEPFSDVVADYERLTAELDPAERGRREGSPPKAWPDVTRSAVQNAAKAAAALRVRLKTSDGGSETSRRVLDALLEQRIGAGARDEARIPFTSDWGFQIEPVFAASQTRLRNRADAEAWIGRLDALPGYFATNIDNLRRGMATGYVAHRQPVANIIAQVREQVVDHPEDSPLYGPFETLPETFDTETASDLQKRGAEAVARALLAYEGLLRFLEYDYAPAARSQPALSSLPGGGAAYRALVARHTTRPDLAPEAVHRLGQSEVARIRIEMEGVIRESGFDGTFGEFLEFLRTDPGFYAETPDQLLAEAARLAKRLDALLPQYFNTLPRLPYGVSPVPMAIAPGYTTARYAPGDPEEGRAGAYLVNTYRLDQRPLYELPALTAHEAVPGHHLQIALAQELRDLPRFRRSYYATAFGEGWALYAERVAGEAGLYETPYEKFGALSYEMWRACRLVADTGLHWFGWPRERAEACFQQNTALTPLNITTEVTRYIGDPGQALGYKIGEITIRELRADAEAALGEAFDIRAFHDLVLAEGATPLDVLEDRVGAWIADQKTERDPPLE